MNKTTVNLVGNLTADPSLKTSGNGESYARFRIACTPRLFKGDQWVDGTTSFYNVTCLRQLAHNVTDSLHKGQQVMVSGELTMREYTVTNEAGQEQTRLSADVLADLVGASLSFGYARFGKVDRGRNLGEHTPDPLTTQDSAEPQADDDRAEYQEDAAA